MSCLSESTLLAILDRRLSRQEMAQVDEHIDRCDACRGLVTCLAHDVSTPGTVDVPLAPPVDSGDTSTPSINALDVGTLLADRYLVLEFVGAGGMGVVYAAYDRQLDRKVAVKMVRADHATPERLVQEARSLARLTHPNVVVVHDVGEALGQAYMAMEFVQGCTLRRWQKDERPNASRILDVYLEAAKGLAAAHAANLVHRDIKPENILLGDDGRVRVMDFGLARAEGAATHSAGSNAESSSPVTTLEGTWPYMAPERFQGQSADARSDQFAYCVSLYEALYGEHPFAFTKFLELPDAIQNGRLRSPPRKSDVDKNVRTVLMRGLSTDPAARFASMDDLASALRAVGRKKRIRTLAIAAIGTIALFGASIAAFASTAPPPPCAGSERLLADVWNPTRKAEIDKAMVDTGLVYAPNTSRTVQDTLDRYAQRWVTTHTQACEATRIHGEQSEDVLDLRMACLGTRLSTLRALTDRLAHADARTVEKAAEATRQLGAPELCDEQHVLAERLPPPDATTDLQVKALRERLARVETQWLLGHDTEALEEAKVIAREAEGVRYLALHAEAGLWFGRLMRSPVDEREKTLIRALHAAEAGSQERMAMEIWMELGWHALWLTAHFDEATRAIDHAEAYATRLGDEVVAVRLLVLRTGILRAQAHNAEALRVVQDAVSRCEIAPRCAQSFLHRALVQLAIMQGITGNVENALVTFDRALTVGEAMLGHDHPAIAAILSDRAVVLMRNNRFKEAAKVLQRGVGIAERSGRRGDLLGVLLENLSTALLRTGDHENALSALHRALALMEQIRSSDHPQTVTTRALQGDILAALKRGDEALAAYQRALTIQAKLPGNDPPELTLEHIRAQFEACGPSCADALKKLDSLDKKQP